MSLTKKDLENIVKGNMVDCYQHQTDTLLIENAALKKMVPAKDDEIAALQLKLNGLEQHNWAGSVRVQRLPSQTLRGEIL
jgi:hypothetical protein